MPPKKKNDDEEKQFRKAFGVEKMREDFNLPAAIYLRDNIHEYIKDKTKAGKALERINKLIQSSAVRTVVTHCGLANPDSRTLLSSAPVSCPCPPPQHTTHSRNLTNIFETQGESHIDVSYSKSKNSDGDGRWFAKLMGSMQNMKRAIWHTICKGILIDLDFVNCHPTLLSQLCKNIR